MTSLQIKYFLAVAEYLNFTRAAESLFVAQPAVTKQIMALEKELGFALFNRHTRSVELTKAGERMQQAFVAMTRIYSTAKNEAQKAAFGDSLFFTVGVLDGMYLQSITDALDALRNRFLDAKINVWRGQSDFLKDELLHNRIDVVLTFDNQLRDELFIDTRSLFASEYNILLPRNHPLASRKQLSRDEIGQQNFILYIDTAKKGHSYSHLGQVCQHLGILAENIIIPPTFSSIYSMVENGTGLALIDEWSEIPHQMRVVKKGTGFYHNFVAAWKRNSKNQLIDIFLENLEHSLQGTVV